jgi:hypothetical protein
MTIRYTVGAEHNPVDRLGRFTLDLGPDGAARIVHYEWGTKQVRTWSPQVDPAMPEQIVAALREARFPTTPEGRMLPDMRYRALHLAGQGSVILEWDHARSLPGYATAFSLIDSLIESVTGRVSG